MPRQEKPSQGQVVVLAQEHRRVGGRHLALAGPVARSQPGRPRHLEPRPQRLDRSHVGEEARAVELIGPVQVTCRRGVAAGPASTAMATNSGSRLSVTGARSPSVARPRGGAPAAVKVADLDVELGQADVQLARARASGPPRALAWQRSLAEPTGAGRPAARHSSASTTWPPSSSTKFPAACRLATASENVSYACTTSPRAQAARPRNPARHHGRGGRRGR